MEAQAEVTSSIPARGDAGSERSAMSKDSGEGGSKGCSEDSAEGSGEQVVVKEQVKAVVGDLENVLGELKTVVGDLRTLVSQIDVVTSKIDEEYGPDGPDGPDVDMQNGIQLNIDREINNRVEAKKSVVEARNGGVEMRVDKRRRSASLLETGTPKREVPAHARHSLSQPFDALGPGSKDWVFHAPADFAQKASDSPRHSNYNTRKRKDEQHVCPAHRSSCSKIEDILSTPKKDDIIICTPGSQCHKKEHAHHGTPHHTPHRRSSSKNKVDLAIYENVPIVSCRTPSKSSSNHSRSPRTSSGSKGHSPRTSNSSGIGNSNESGNGNTFVSCSKREKSQRHKSHHHHHNHQRPSSTPAATKCSVMVDNTTQVDLSKKLVANYFLSCEDNRKNGLVSVADDLGRIHPNGQFISKPHGPSNEVHPLQQQNDPQHCVPCSPSPDSDYCGVYERELDLKLELIFEDDLENCDDRRTLDLQSHPDYGSTYDRERVSRWAAYTLVNIGSLPMSDDQFAETPSDASSDILNDNVFITTAAELRREQEAKSNWSSVFERYYRHSLESPDTG